MMTRLEVEAMMESTIDSMTEVEEHPTWSDVDKRGILASLATNVLLCELWMVLDRKQSHE